MTMKQKEWKKRMTAMLLAILMLVSSVPVTELDVSAEEKTDQSTEPGAGYNTESDADNSQEGESEDETIVVEDIRLSRTYLNMETGDTASLFVAVYPEDAVYEEIIWTSDAPEIASVTGEGTDAVVTANTEVEGMAVITVTVGEIMASCEVLVSPKTSILESLKFTSTTSPDDAYELSDQDKNTHSYELIVPVSDSAVYVWTDLKDGFENVEVTAAYTDYTGDAVEKNLNTAGSYTNLSFLLKSGSLAKSQINITITTETLTEVYTVDVYRGTGMSDVTIKNENGAVLEYTPAFAFDTKYYNLYVPSNMETVNISMTPADESCTSFFVNGLAASQEYTLDVAADSGRFVVGCTDGAETKAIEYVFFLKYLPVCQVNFEILPEDTLVSVYDADGIRVNAEPDSSYWLVQGEQYTYIASKSGYISVKGSFTASAELVVELSLEKINDNGEATSLYAEWGGVYKQETNQNILSAKLPTSADNAGIDWVKDFDSLSGISLIDGMIYCYDKSNLMMIDRESGEIIRQTALAGKGQTENANKPVYGGGKIFVALTNGSIQAFDAFTLESLWLYQNTEGGLLTCGIKYDSGYVYAGLTDSDLKSGMMLCISAEDEDPFNDKNQKTYIWKQTITGGYYKMCPFVANGIVYAVSYDGKLFCINQQTGEVRQTVSLGTMGGTAAGIAYYGGRIYFSTIKGYVCSYLITENGVDSGSCQSISLGGFSESTPVIYKDRMYVGYSAKATEGQPHGTAPYYLGVVTIDYVTGAMALAYQLSLNGQLNGSVTLNASENDEYASFYYTENNGSYVKSYVGSDHAGQTEASSDNGYLKLSESASAWAVGAVTASEDGVLYVRSTDGQLYSVSRTELLIHNVSVSDDQAVIDSGSFYSFVEDHEVMLGVGVTSTLFTVSVPEGIDVTVDGKHGNSCEVFLADGEADVEVMISNGLTTKTYQFHFYEVSHNTRLGTLFISNGTNFTLSGVTSYYPAEILSEDQDTYTIRYVNKPSTVYLWANPEEGGSESMVVKTISGFGSNNKKLAANAYTNGAFYYRANLGMQDSAVLEITVTAPDGITKKTYTVIIEKDTTTPVICDTQILTDTRTANSIDVRFTASESGYLYYLLYDKSQSTMPTTANYGTSGVICRTRVQQGENTITISGLSKDSQYLYAVMRDSAGNFSVYTKPIQGTTGAAPEIPMTEILLNTDILFMESGDSRKIKAELLPSGTSDEPVVTWTTDNPYVAAVDGAGLSAVITAVGGGIAEITVQADVDGTVYTAKCQVKVPITVNTVVLSSESIELYEGETIDLTAAFMPTELEVVPKIIWRNSNNTVVSMNHSENSAHITALSAGTATIEVLAGRVSAKCVITVKSYSVTGDIDQDGDVDVFDAKVILDMINGSAAMNQELADLDHDQDIDVFDANMILDMIKQSNL